MEHFNDLMYYLNLTNMNNQSWLLSICCLFHHHDDRSKNSL